MITAIVLLAIALLCACAFIVRGALVRRFARVTSFESVWHGEQHLAEPPALGFRAWLVRFGKEFVS